MLTFIIPDTEYFFTALMGKSNKHPHPFPLPSRERERETRSFFNLPYTPKSQEENLKVRKETFPLLMEGIGEGVESIFIIVSPFDAHS